MLCTMTDRKTTGTNQAKLSRVWDALDSLLRQVLKQGFHGTAAIELTIQDGTIQRLNKRLLAGQLVDLVLRGFGFAMWNLAKAAIGFFKLTFTGKFEPGPDDGPRPAP